MIAKRLVRNLRSDLGYAMSFVVTLGLGVGANAALFSLVSGVLIKPLPYPDSGRLVALEQIASRQGTDNQKFSFVELEDYRAGVESLEEIVEYGEWSFNVLDRGEPHRTVAGLVTAGFFQLLGMEPQHGRLLIPSDRLPSAQPVAVITDRYWRSVMAADPNVIGQQLNLTSSKAEIVGILKPSNHYLGRRDEPDFYANYSSNNHYVSATMQEQRDHRMTTSFARLSASATLDEAQAEVDYIAQQLHDEYPQAYPEDFGFTTQVTPLQEALVSNARPILLASFAGSLLVLLIACSNVSNLTMVRALARRRELAIRMTLGSSVKAQRGYLFIETLTLALVGAGLGALLAKSFLHLLREFAATLTTRVGAIAVDYRVVAFSFFVATACALTFALLPGLVPKHDLPRSLAEGAPRSAGSVFRGRTQRLLVVGQLAISFLLLFASIQLQRTLYNLYSVDPGFELDQVLTVTASKFSGATRDQLLTFTRQSIEQISALPSVESVAMTGSPPLGGSNSFPLKLRADGVTDRAEPTSQATLFATVTPGYFSTLGVPLLVGRDFDSSDRVDTTPVAILNETAARILFGDTEPVGRRISYDMGALFGGESNWLTVVGVVADMRTTSLQAPPEQALYIPDQQSLPPGTFVIRTRASDPYQIVPAVSKVIRDLDAERPLEDIRTLSEARDLSVKSERLNALLFGAFAALALGIASIGVAAMLAWNVSSSKRELAIRAAIGATGGSLIRRVLKESSVLILAGALLGSVGAFAFSKVLANMLYGVDHFNIATLVLSGILLVLVGLLASLVPARMAAKAAPASLLRLE